MTDDLNAFRDAQRQRAGPHEIAGSGALILPEHSCVQHLKVYERKCQDAGFSKLHGLRQAYAQERYRELTERAAPTAGGLRSRWLSPEEKR